MDFEISDGLLGTLVPIAVYWIYSGIYVLLGSYCENYRLHSKRDEDEKNLVSKGDVVRGVLFQQMVQAVISLLLFAVRFGRNKELYYSQFLFDCFFLLLKKNWIRFMTEAIQITELHCNIVFRSCLSMYASV